MRLRMFFVLALVFLPSLVLAGPNAGGVLLVHANTSLVYTTDPTEYCGQSGLAACSLAVTSVPWDPETTTVFYVLAAFPDTAHPRLKAVSWGVQWDDSKLEMVAHGTCADFEIPDGGWPASGKGIGLIFPRFDGHLEKVGYFPPGGVTWQGNDGPSPGNTSWRLCGWPSRRG